MQTQGCLGIGPKIAIPCGSVHWVPASAGMTPVGCVFLTTNVTPAEAGAQVTSPRRSWRATQVPVPRHIWRMRAPMSIVAVVRGPPGCDPRPDPSHDRISKWPAMPAGMKRVRDA